MSKKRKSLNRIFREASESLEFEVETAKLLFTEELLGIMEQKGINRTQLAEELGVKPPRVTALLRGDNNFTLETMIHICRSLGVKYRHHIQAPGCTTYWLDSSHGKFVSQQPVMATGRLTQKVVRFPTGKTENPGYSPIHQEKLHELAIAS